MVLQGEGRGIETYGRYDSSNPESLLSNLAAKIQEVDSRHTRNWFKSRKEIGPSMKKKGSFISSCSLGVKYNATDSPRPLGFYEYISLFICLQLQGHLHKDEHFQLVVWSCDIPVKTVTCVVLPSVKALLFDSFPVWKVFPALLFLDPWHYFFNKGDELEDCASISL